jgi:toxin-antitoxin system PIN domain toxin
VIIPDINILVHAYNKDAAEHRVVRQWWENALRSLQPIGLPWVSILGFIRVSTIARLTKRPLYPQEATAHVRAWLTAPNASIVTPGDDHAKLLLGMLDELGAAGNLTTDAHLAALAIEYHAELVSTDADFARFRGLRWFNPTEVRK